MSCPSECLFVYMWKRTWGLKRMGRTLESMDRFLCYSSASLCFSTFIIICARTYLPKYGRYSSLAATDDADRSNSFSIETACSLVMTAQSVFWMPMIIYSYSFVSSHTLNKMDILERRLMPMSYDNILFGVHIELILILLLSLLSAFFQKLEIRG